MEERKLARVPRHVKGQIPNFAGSEEAARRLAALPEFEKAAVVKVNPDAPQRMVRYAALKAGKTLLTPTPRLREGFLHLDPQSIPNGKLLTAASIAVAARYGPGMS